MISTAQEALLLLNKWRSDSSLVVVVSAFPYPAPDPSQAPSAMVVRFTGRVREISSTGIFLMRGDRNDDDFLVSAIENCIFGYETTMPTNLPEPMLKATPQNWDSMLFIQFPGGGAMVLFADETVSSNQN